MADQYSTVGYGAGSTDTAVGGLGAVQAAINTLVVLQAAMVVVGSGDNSANVTTMGTDLTALQTAVTAIGSGGTTQNAIVITVDTSRFTSRSACLQIINQIAQTAVSTIAGP